MMKRRIGLATLAALLMLAAFTQAFADIPRPRNPGPQPTPTPSARMVIGIDAGATEAKLVIPRDALGELGAASGTQSSSAGVFGATVSSGAQTAVAGAFLSLAFVLGGVWLVRRRKAGGMPRAALGVLALAVLGATGGLVYANIAPPRAFHPLNADILATEAKRSGVAGRVRVEIVEGDGQIMLVLPQQN